MLQAPIKDMSSRLGIFVPLEAESWRSVDSLLFAPLGQRVITLRGFRGSCNWALHPGRVALTAPESTDGDGPRPTTGVDDRGPSERVRRLLDEDAGEGLLAAAQHGHAAARHAPSRVAASSSTARCSRRPRPARWRAGPRSGSRRARCRRATVRSGHPATSSCSAARASADSRVSASSAARSPCPNSACDAAITASVASRAVHERRDLVGEHPLRLAPERLASRRAPRAPRCSPRLRKVKTLSRRPRRRRRC